MRKHLIRLGAIAGIAAGIAAGAGYAVSVPAAHHPASHAVADDGMFHHG